MFIDCIKRYLTCHNCFVWDACLVQHGGNLILEDCVGFSWSTMGVNEQQHSPSWWGYTAGNVYRLDISKAV